VKQIGIEPYFGNAAKFAYHFQHYFRPGKGDAPAEL